MTSMNTADGTTDIREFGHELWSYLTGNEAVIEYSFTDMTVEVPQTTGGRLAAGDVEAQRHAAGAHRRPGQPGRARAAARNGTS